MKFENKNEAKIDTKLALRLLKDGYLLKANNPKNNLHNVFSYEDEKINVYSPNYKLKITTSDFLEFFNDFNFHLIKEEKENDIDLAKDVEYFSKIQKRQ